ncbi:hypothetical protein [Kordiimonas pumila]|uniref:Uncharacterized protein n=1 Tax=Kordiimonas pumila TaxID=2161677 RepID=A0ABV7D5H3_9PROT|nr:hypothetical protein [Kordiimonas pumila]
MQSIRVKTESIQKYQQLYGAPDPVLAVHFMIGNQRAAREHFKDKWPELVPILEVHIGRILKSKLGANDILIRREALSYYIICTDRDLIEMTNFCKRIAAHVFEKIFSNDIHLQKLQISLSALSVDMANVTNDSALKKALFTLEDSEGQSTIVSRDNYAACKPEQIDHSLVRQIAALRGTCDQFFSAISKVPDTDETLKEYHSELRRVRRAANIISRGISSLLKDTDDIEATDDSENATDTPTTTTSVPAEESVKQTEAESIRLDVEKQIAPDAEVAYFPVWNVPKQLIDIYRCSIIRHLPSGIVEVNTGSETQHGSFVVDNLIVRKVLADLPEFTGPDADCMLYMPLHANTILSDQHFAQITSKLKPLTLVERKQLLIGIHGITENTSAETIQKLTIAVKPYCRTINFRITGNKSLSSVIKKAGGSAIGLHVDDVLTTSANITENITQLATEADSVHILSFTEGVHSVALAATAIGAGISYISGEAIASPLELPWGALEFKVESLYSRVISD